MKKSIVLLLVVAALALTACGVKLQSPVVTVSVEEQIATKCAQSPAPLSVTVGGSTYSCASSGPATVPTQGAQLDAGSSEGITIDCSNTNWFDASVNPEGNAIDVALIGTEPCAATWRSANGQPANAVCPSGWICTFDVVGDIVRVYAGTGQVVNVRAATWRPEGDFCEVLAGEINFANSQTPTFQVKPANGSPACGQ